MSEPAPRVAALTPAGRGGVSVVAIAGAGAASVLARAFRGKTGSLPSEGRIALGALEDAAGVVDEVLLARTSTERFELGCHGGPGVARRAVAALVAAGAREVPALELERDAGASTDATQDAARDATRDEARERLALAPTELTARTLARQATGALGSLARELARRAREAREESGRVALLAAIDALAATTRFGLACSCPPAVALVGRPNAGKSTLFNALAGRERAIVSPEPGTTRDVLEEVVSLDGLPVRVLDLAGVRASADEVERLGVARGLARAGEAAVRILVVDASAADAADALEVLRASGEPSVVALTKSDLADAGSLADLGVRLRARVPGVVCAVSAVSGEGLEELGRAIVRACVGTVELEELSRGAVVFTERQRVLVESARAALAAGDGSGATSRFLEIMGPIAGAERSTDR